jgi:propionate CoA-transferase
MTGVNFLLADAAVAMIEDDAVVGLVGGGGGLVEASTLHEAAERRFLKTGHPRNLTCIHALGIGDRRSRGMNRFAHAGMTSRVIGGHWIWSPRMQQMARDNEIEAYVLPGGVIMQLMREVAAGRPGLITHVGLGTFVDPRQEGGRLNEAAKADLTEIISIDGREYLRYLPIPVSVALLRGSYADEDGNISLEEEPANLDIYAMAAAAHNSGGKVIFQVKGKVPRNSLKAREVRIPGALVDAVVIDPCQRQGYDLVYDAALSGEAYRDNIQEKPLSFSPRLVIARRAQKELIAGSVINFGFGIPDQVAKLISRDGHTERYFQTIEHGTYGGQLMDGDLFGYALNPTCMIDGPSQFDFYSGGGLDIAFLGFGEMDRHGNVNVSKLAGNTIGPGGFIDIAQNARTVVFCGTFDTGGAVLEIGDGKLQIKAHGRIAKLIEEVAQITFSGQQALAQRQRVIYITERAVFKLTSEGVELIEIAPGVDLQEDVLDRMGFVPQIVGTPAKMHAALFNDDGGVE